jgi:HEAT repeat protein
MGLLGNRRPNVKLLVRREDLEGLVDAVFYEEVAQESGGQAQRTGAPIREEAVLALADFGSERAGAAVSDALADRSDKVRSAAVRVLYGWGDSDALAEAAAVLPPDRGQARALALRGLRELGQPGAALSLSRALVHAEHGEPLTSEDSELVLELMRKDAGGSTSHEVIEMLASALRDDRAPVRDRAEELLVRLAPASTRAVASALVGETPTPRAAAVLARIADGSCLMPLATALEHSDPEVRAESCVALGELRDPGGVEALLRASRDADHRVRTQAGRALDRIGTAAVILGFAAAVRPAVAEAVEGAKKPATRKKRATSAKAGSTKTRPAAESTAAGPAKTEPAEPPAREPATPSWVSPAGPERLLLEPPAEVRAAGAESSEQRDISAG